MTPEEFKIRRKALWRSRDAAAEAFGISKASIALYETGVRVENGESRPVEIPRVVELALCELERRAKEAKTDPR